jgi:hypothetical protein
MKAAVFAERGRIVLESRPVPDVGPLAALGCGLCHPIRPALSRLRNAARISKASARWYATTIKPARKEVTS